MAAINPMAAPEADEEGNIPAVPRSTLQIVKISVGGDDESDEDEDDALERLLAGEDDSEESEEEEANGGPSDPSKSKKAQRAAALKKLMAAAAEEGSDEEMGDAGVKVNGAKSKKGKAKASEESEEESEEESDEEGRNETEQYVVCTLDTERVSVPLATLRLGPPMNGQRLLTYPQNYQQPIDITVLKDESIFFLVSGTHSVYLTGNYVIPAEEEDDEDSDDEYDLPPGLDELDDSELSDELDDIEGVPRVKEIDTDEEEAPKLVETKKGKNKRVAEEEAEGLDELMAQDGKKLSKKQQKKLKTEAAAKESPASAKSDKKVQFAKELEQGPTGPAKEKAEKAADKKAAAPSVKVVQGVTIDDRKIGTGRTVKNGDKVGMRYIGKLLNGKLFDGKFPKAPAAVCSSNG
jgi:FK506-binding nuclear protein